MQEVDQTIHSHKDAEFLDVQAQYGEAVLWALVDPSQPSCIYTIKIYGTGHMVYENHLKHLGTFQLMEGQFIGHVFLELPV
jgi:hypothetical protein